MKIVMTVFGTRPEAIKMSPLVRVFQKYTQYFETVICMKGQHRDMLDMLVMMSLPLRSGLL